MVSTGTAARRISAIRYHHKNGDSVFSHNEIREFVVKLGRRWFFPDFSNKITWAIISLGAGVVLTPTPIKLVFYNWLVDSLNLNSGNHFSLAELGPAAAEYWLGFALITSAFTHNLLSKWLQLSQVQLENQDKAAILEADRILFGKFMDALPSGSRSIYLLQEHDFGNSFSLESLVEFDNFVSGWNYAEKKFINEELETLRNGLWQKCNKFSLMLAEKSSPTGDGRFQSVVPNRHSDFDWPKWIADDVNAVNSMASEVVGLHQSFITTAKRALKC